MFIQADFVNGFAQRAPVRIIARPKLSGFGEHWGVQLPDARVVHRTTTGNEVVSFRDFAQGRSVREVKKAKPEQYGSVMLRVNSALRAPAQYRLLDNNCEHFATWLLDGEPESPQVSGAAILGLTLLALNALST